MGNSHQKKSIYNTATDSPSRSGTSLSENSHAEKIAPDTITMDCDMNHYDNPLEKILPEELWITIFKCLPIRSISNI
jgi:hypothetical protein